MIDAFCSCYEFSISLLDKMQISDWIDIFSIIADILIAVVVTKIVTQRLSADRELRNFFITEVRELSQKYKSFIQDILDEKVVGKNAISYGKKASMEIDEVMRCVSKKYGIDKNMLKNVKKTLKFTLLNFSWHEKSGASENAIRLKNGEIFQLNRLHMSNCHSFNDLIMLINEQKERK